MELIYNTTYSSMDAKFVETKTMQLKWSCLGQIFEYDSLLVIPNALAIWQAKPIIYEERQKWKKKWK